jgi:hypothetical protein
MLKDPFQTVMYYMNALFKALRKTEFSELFVFVSLGIVPFSKLRIFLEISGFFELAKILECRVLAPLPGRSRQ